MTFEAAAEIDLPELFRCLDRGDMTPEGVALLLRVWGSSFHAYVVRIGAFDWRMILNINLRNSSGLGACHLQTL
jgi:hypothetical protein